MHESWRENIPLRAGSERSFGLVFAAVFILFALFPLLDHEPPRLWALGTAAALGVLSFFAPRLLRPLNLAWFRFGLLLHQIVSPLVLAILFFLAVTPTGLIMRLCGKDILRLQRDPAVGSYWLTRDPPGPAPETMKNQF